MKNTNRLSSGEGDFEAVSGFCIAVSKSGKYKKLALFKRRFPSKKSGCLFASIDGEFIRLLARGTTTMLGLSWDEIFVSRIEGEIAVAELEGAILSWS